MTTNQKKSSLTTKQPLRRKTPLRAKRYPKPKEKTIFDATEVKTKKPIENKKKHTDELDKVFQFYVRLRDSRPDGRCQCISCGRFVPFSNIQAGHFRSRIHMATRWSELNVNGECATCNLEWRNGDHLLDYRINLVRKIGENKVKWLEAYCKETVKWSDFELVLMIKDYSQKCLALSKEKGIPISKIVQRIINKYENM